MSTKQVDIDPTSFQLGMINCFAEMVAVGVKRLALSPPLTPDEYERVRGASDTIVEGFGIQSYLEKSLLVTDLQTPEFTEGKWSILYFKDESTLAEYQELKECAGRSEAEGGYAGDFKRQVSREFMRLLSYPEDVIEAKLEDGGRRDPFMLTESS